MFLFELFIANSLEFVRSNGPNLQCGAEIILSATIKPRRTTHSVLRVNLILYPRYCGKKGAFHVLKC